MKNLSQLKKLSVKSLLEEFVGGSFPFDWADCGHCLIGEQYCTAKGHSEFRKAVTNLMAREHEEKFGNRLRTNITALYNLRIKYASFYPTPVPTKFPVKRKKKAKESFPLIRSIYARDSRKDVR